MIIGRFDAAQVEFEQGLRYKPDSAEIHYNLGKLFSIQDNWEPARKAFEAALRIDPSYIEALDALGFALEALGDDAGAVANYEKAIALERQRARARFASAHVNLSAYYNRTGDTGKGARIRAPGRSRSIPSPTARGFRRGGPTSGSGSLDEAVDALNQAIILNARASSYYYVLAGVYRRLGRTEESRKALEAFTRLEQESERAGKEAARRATPASSAPDAGA